MTFSIRIPLIVYDPRLPKAKRGIRKDNFVLNVDMAPTILDYARADIPKQMQGKSIQKVIKGKDKNWRKSFFYEHHLEWKKPGRPTIPKSEAVRTERWKYIRYIESEPLFEELYDLHIDPDETTNLIASVDNDESLKKQLDALRKQWAKLRKSVK